MWEMMVQDHHMRNPGGLLWSLNSKGEVAGDSPLRWPKLVENCSGKVSAAQLP